MLAESKDYRKSHERDVSQEDAAMEMIITLMPFAVEDENGLMVAPLRWTRHLFLKKGDSVIYERLWAVNLLVKRRMIIQRKNGDIVLKPGIMAEQKAKNAFNDELPRFNRFTVLKMKGVK